jgi:hypothetical protein
MAVNSQRKDNYMYVNGSRVFVVGNFKQKLYSIFRLHQEQFAKNLVGFLPESL